MNIHRYTQLAKKVDEAKATLQRNQGNLDALKLRLKKDFGCATIAEAKDTLVEIKLRISKESKSLEKEAAAFEQKYGL